MSVPKTKSVPQIYEKSLNITNFPLNFDCILADPLPQVINTPLTQNILLYINLPIEIRQQTDILIEIQQESSSNIFSTDFCLLMNPKPNNCTYNNDFSERKISFFSSISGFINDFQNQNISFALKFSLFFNQTPSNSITFNVSIKFPTITFAYFFIPNFFCKGVLKVFEDNPNVSIISLNTTTRYFDLTLQLNNFILNPDFYIEISSKFWLLYKIPQELNKFCSTNVWFIRYFYVSQQKFLIFFKYYTNQLSSIQIKCFIPIKQPDFLPELMDFTIQLLEIGITQPFFSSSPKISLNLPIHTLSTSPLKSEFLIKNKLFGSPGLDAVYVFEFLFKNPNVTTIIFKFPSSFPQQLNNLKPVACFLDTSSSICQIIAPRTLEINVIQSPLDKPSTLVLINIQQPYISLSNRISILLRRHETEENDYIEDFPQEPIDSFDELFGFIFISAIKLSDASLNSMNSIEISLRLWGETRKFIGISDNTLFLKLPAYLNYGDVNPATRFLCSASLENKENNNILKNCILFDPMYLELVFNEDIVKYFGEQIFLRIENFPNPIYKDSEISLFFLEFMMFLLKTRNFNNVLIKSNQFYLESIFGLNKTRYDIDCSYSTKPVIFEVNQNKFLSSFTVSLKRTALIPARWFECQISLFDNEKFVSFPNKITLSYTRPTQIVFLAAKTGFPVGIHFVYWQKNNCPANDINNLPAFKVQIWANKCLLRPSREDYEVSGSEISFPIVFQMNDCIPTEIILITGRISENLKGLIAFSDDNDEKKIEVSMENDKHSAIFMVKGLMRNYSDGLVIKGAIFWELVARTEIKESYKIIDQTPISYNFQNILELIDDFTVEIYRGQIRINSIKNRNKLIFALYWLGGHWEKNPGFQQVFDKVIEKRERQKFWGDFSGILYSSEFSMFNVNLSEFQMKPRSEYQFFIWISNSMAPFLPKNLSITTKDNGSRYFKIIITFLHEMNSEMNNVVACLFVFGFQTEISRVFTAEPTICDPISFDKPYDFHRKTDNNSTMTLFFDFTPEKHDFLFEKLSSECQSIDFKETFNEVSLKYGFQNIFSVENMSLQIKPVDEINNPKVPLIFLEKESRFTEQSINFQVEFTIKKSAGFLFFTLQNDNISFSSSLEFRVFGNKKSMKTIYLNENDTFVVEFKGLEPNSFYFLYFMVSGDYAPSKEIENIYSEVFVEVFSSEINDEQLLKAFGVGISVSIGVPVCITLIWLVCGSALARCISKAGNIKFNDINSSYMEQLQGNLY